MRLQIVKLRQHPALPKLITPPCAFACFKNVFKLLSFGFKKPYYILEERPLIAFKGHDVLSVMRFDFAGNLTLGIKGIDRNCTTS